MCNILNNQITETVSLALDADKFHVFSSFLQQGFMLRIQTGHSVKNMLCKQFGVAPEYVDDHISTIFLDGKPVDDADSAVIKNGSTLALSAAMPGLVGTTFRKGGHLASFRSTITHQKEDMHVPIQEGIVVLKLFNLLVRELGPFFLEQGILIKGKNLEDLLKSRYDDLKAGCRAVSLNGKETDLDRLAEMNLSDRQGHVLLQICKPGL